MLGRARVAHPAQVDPGRLQRAERPVELGGEDHDVVEAQCAVGMGRRSGAGRLPRRGALGSPSISPSAASRSVHARMPPPSPAKRSVTAPTRRLPSASRAKPARSQGSAAPPSSSSSRTMLTVPPYAAGSGAPYGPRPVRQAAAAPAAKASAASSPSPRPSASARAAANVSPHP